MEIKFSKVPTAEEIAEMKNEPEVWRTYPAVLEGNMIETAQVYQTWENKRVQFQAEFDEAYAKFQEANKTLIENLTEAKTEAFVAREFLQQAAIAHRHITGDKTWKAFQAAESWKPLYNEKDMLDWALYDAPRAVREQLIMLNTKAVEKFILDQLNERGVPRPAPVYEVAIIPAIGQRIYTGKVLTKELEALVADKPSSEPTPAKLIDPIGETVTIQVVDPIRFLTQDELRPARPSPLDDLLTPTEKQLIRLSETPTPVDPIPAVALENDDTKPPI